MGDNTLQGGTDVITTDEITEQDGVAQSSPFAKAQFIKAGYGTDGKLWSVTENRGLPTGAAYMDVPLVAGQTTFTTAANGTAIDTLGFNWATIQMTAGYTSMTALTVQGSNDNVNWVTLAMCPVGSTGTGITTALGIVAAMYHGPIPCRYIRFVPVGAGGGGTLTLSIRLLGEALVLNSQGVNAGGTVTIGGLNTGVAPAISNAAMTLGTASGNAWQYRATGTALLALGTALAAVAAQMPYITDMHMSVWGVSAVPWQARIVAAAAALGEVNLTCPPNDSVSRVFRHPYKPMSTINNILQSAVNPIGTAAGTWELIVNGYYQTG